MKNKKEIENIINFLEENEQYGDGWEAEIEVLKNTAEREVENYTNGYGRGFEVGFTHGWNMTKGGRQWTDVMEEQPPKDTRILYFFECTGVSAGYYEGREDEYPGENDHVFSSHDGFLTGDVTHWMHMPGEPKPHVDLSGSVRVERHYDDGTSETETIKMPDYDDGTMGMKAE